MGNQTSQPKHIMLYLPTWVGDMVMATPTLRAIREGFPDVKITYLSKGYAKDLIADAPWYDRIVTLRTKKDIGKQLKSSARKRRGKAAFVGRLRQMEIDTCILLKNSFGSAMLAAAANIPRRIGYDRDARSVLLTDRLLPLKQKGKYIPVPAVDYYLGLVHYLHVNPDRMDMELYTNPVDDELAANRLKAAGIDLHAKPLIMFCPGSANKGDAKLWPADRYGALAKRLVENVDAQILLTGAPNEKPILDEVQKHCPHKLWQLPEIGSSLKLLKSYAKLATMAVCNDTGPRHIAAAFKTPVVSLFGPTDPRWTAIPFEEERVIHIDETMTSISTDLVYDTSYQLLRECTAFQS